MKLSETESDNRVALPHQEFANCGKAVHAFDSRASHDRRSAMLYAHTFLFGLPHHPLLCAAIGNSAHSLRGWIFPHQTAVCAKSLLPPMPSASACQHSAHKSVRPSLDNIIEWEGYTRIYYYWQRYDKCIHMRRTWSVLYSQPRLHDAWAWAVQHAHHVSCV